MPSMRSFRFAVSCGALLAVALAADAARAVSFDFSIFPDSAGCSGPTPVSEGPHANCDPDWADEWEAGIIYEHVHTVDGLTLTLTTFDNGGGVDWGWMGEVISCGNTPDCTPYLADFSLPLLDVSIELLAVANNCGCGSDDLTAVDYYLEAWSGPQATGNLLGGMVLPASGGPATLSFTAAPGTTIASILFGASTLDHGECDGLCENLGVADNLIATPVPEPATALLVVLGLLGLAANARRS